MAIAEKEYEPEEIASVDPWFWAYWNRIQLQGGEFSTDGREYQVDLLQSEARKRCYKKGTQLGFTEIENLRTLHGQIHGLYPRGVLVLFPTADDVSDFSKSRFAPLIKSNPQSIGRFIQETDSTEIKNVAGSFLYLRGARVTQRVEGQKKESSKLRSLPVDKVSFDEVDLMDPDMISLALKRLGDSKVKEEVYTSTPTIPGFGIDALYQGSTQHIWIIKCRSCRRDCCLELDFPNCVREDKNGRFYRACVKCGAELNPSDGFWVAQFPGREMEGRWISRLNSHRADPGEILRLYNDPPNGNVQEVYNSELGMAYIAAENKLTVNDVYACCRQEAMATKDNGPCAMGVDVGKFLHVVIGHRKNGKKKILYVGAVSEFSDLSDLGKRFNVKKVAIDFYPETRQARQFQKKAGFSTQLIIYLDKMKAEDEPDYQLGVTKVARTELCDRTHHAVISGEYSLPRRNPAIEEYALQMTNIAKVLDVDDLRGTKIYRYRKLGPDHYRHATNYFELACQGLPEATDDPIRDIVRKTMQEQQSVFNPLTHGLGVRR